MIEDGKLNEAIEMLQNLQTNRVQVKGLHHELGLAYYRQGSYPKAESEFAMAIQEDPADHEAVQLRGISLFQSGRPSAAIPLLKQVQSWSSGSSVEASYTLALAYIQLRSYEDARKEVAVMFGVPQDSAASYLFTARMLLRQEHDPIAEEYAHKAAVIDPKLPLVHFLLGEFYLYKSDPARAAEEFEKEIQLNPAYAGSYDRLADTYTRTAKYDDAERALRRALLLDANATGPYILMGKVQLKKKDYAQASMYLERAVKMDANNFMTHHLLGEAYRGAGKVQDSERELRISEELQSKQHSQLETLH